MNNLVDAVVAAALTPTQVDELQTWLIWQYLARVRRSRRGRANRARRCADCSRLLGSPVNGPARRCASCANRRSNRERVARRREAAAEMLESAGLA